MDKRDPAFLYYDGDAARDVSHMNRLERGCYFDLMQAQRKFHGFTLEQARKILGMDFELCWDAIELILKKEGDTYFIQWVKDSTEKRERYSELQRVRANSRWGKNNAEKENSDTESVIGNTESYQSDATALRLHCLKENEIENENEIEEEKEKNLIIPEFRECSELLRKRILERRQGKIDEKKLLSWDRDVRLMVQRDGRTVEQIKLLINECHDMPPTGRDGFTWRENILSMGTLREKWNESRIAIGMTNKKVYQPEQQELIVSDGNYVRKC